MSDVSSRPALPDRPLRIAYVTGSLELGGSERQMLLLARFLPRDRFRVEFVLLARRGELAEAAEAAGAIVHVLRAPARGSVPFALWALRVTWKVLRYVWLVRRRRYDVIDAWLFDAYGLAAVTRPLTRVPVLVAGRRSLSDFKERFGFLQLLVDAVARRSANVLVANADAVAHDVRRREGVPADRLRVIRNGVELPELPTAEERRRLRAAWGVDDDAALVIGCVANYKAGKGLELLVDAFAPVAERHPSAQLVLIGEGPLWPELARRAARHGLAARVHLVGAVIDPRPLYGAFDIAVLASETEGLPNVLLEAAAAARALVATDAGGSREIVRDGASGLLVGIGDGPALSDALDRLAADAALRERLGAAARRLIEQEFSVDRCVAAFASLYEELVAARRSRSG